MIYLAKLPQVQTYIAKEIASSLSEKAGCKITVGAVRFSNFNSFSIKDLYIEDYRKDTMFFASRLDVVLDSFNISKDEYRFKKVRLKDFYFNLTENKKALLNIEYLIDSLSNPRDTTSSNFSLSNISFKRVILENSRFNYVIDKHEIIDYGINWEDIGVLNLNIDVSNLHFKGDTSVFHTNKLSLKEKSGFVLKWLKGDAEVATNYMGLDNIRFKTPYSLINLERMQYNWVVGQNYWPDFITKMKQLYVVKNSYASFRDIAYFNGKLKGLKEVVYGSGTGFNTIDKFQVKDIDLKFGEHSIIKGSFDSDGLPNILDAKYIAKFDTLIINQNDVENIYIPWIDSKKIVIWDKFRNLGNLSFNGIFKGKITDGLCTGILDTDIGSLVTNVKLLPGSRNRSVNIKGFVNFVEFDVGKFFNNKSIGRLNLIASVDGYLNQDVEFVGSLAGNVSDFSLLHYTYHNMYLEGEIDRKKFSGRLNMDDDNINLSFSGLVDFNKKMPSAKFDASIGNLNLKELHLFDKDVTIFTKINADFEGTNINDIKGRINVADTKFIVDSDIVDVKNFTLFTGIKDKVKKISLESDFLKANLMGKYELPYLIQDFWYIIYSNLPNFTPPRYNLRSYSSNSFKLDLKVDNINEILNIFYPDVYVSNNTSLNWNYRYSSPDIKLDIHSEGLRYKKTVFKDLDIRVNSKKENVKSKISLGTFILLDKFKFFNVKSKLEASDNKIRSSLSWNNWGISTYGGYFSCDALVVKDANNKPKLDINFDEGSLIVADSVWTFKPSHLVVASKHIEVDNFEVYKKNHFINISGLLTRNKDNSMSMTFSNCDFSRMYSLIGDDDSKFRGIINGGVRVSNIFDKIQFTSDLSINDFTYDGHEFGDITINSIWNNKSQTILMDINSIYNNEKKINIVGTYEPSNNNIDLNVILSKCPLSYVDLFIKDYAQIEKGEINANLHLGDKLKSPKIDGSIQIDSAQIVSKSTRVKYHFSDSLLVDNNTVNFKDFTIYDPNNNEARLNGMIKFLPYFKSKLLLSMNNFMVLNSNFTDNQNFYGKAFLTGKSDVVGDSKNLDIDIKVKTNKLSELFIPISNSVASNAQDCLTFISHEEKEVEEDDKLLNRKKTFKKVESVFNYNVNCNLEITDDVDTQIIFNKQVGDILKAKGRGDLKISMSSTKDLEMYGKYNLSEGSYMFSLQNIVNKKFELGEGGSISWNGDPLLANVDITAIYKLRTNLYDLMPNDDDPNISKTSKVPVNCIMHISNSIMDPNVKFNIDFPTLNEQNKSYVQGLFRSEDDMNEQILYLMVLNRFNTPNYMQLENSNRNIGAAAGLTTVSEMLSNQFSNLISQISDDFDIGFKYRPEDEVSSNEFELALSTQLFSDRVRLNVNGNIDTGSNKNAVTRDNPIVGDFDLDIKLNEKGNLRLKAYTHTNDQITYKSSKTTQGVGIIYREEFNSFTDLLKSYFRAIFGKKKKKKKAESKEKTQPDTKNQ